MGKKKGKKKGGTGGDDDAEPQPSTSSAPDGAPAQGAAAPPEGAPPPAAAEGGKKRGKGRKWVPLVLDLPSAPTSAPPQSGMARASQHSMAHVPPAPPQIVPPAPPQIVPPAPPQIVPPAPPSSVPPTLQLSVPPVEQPEATGAGGGKKKRGKGMQAQPAPGPEAPRTSPPQELSVLEPWAPGSRRGHRMAPAGRGMMLQPAQRPLPQPGSPRVSPSQELPPSEPRQPGLQRGPPPGMGAKSQAAQRPSTGSEPSRASAAQPRGPPAGTARPVSVQQVTKEVTRMALHKIPPRKKTGTVGKKIRVATNMLALNLNRLKSDVAIHYDVTIEPDKPRRLFIYALEEFRKKYYPNRYPAFDGRKNLYSCGELPFGDSISGEVKVRDSESMRDKDYKITLKYASEVDLQSLRSYMRSGSSLQAPQRALQAIDVVLRHAASFRFVKVGRSYFTPPTGGVIDLGDGHEMWYGFFQSAILGWRPFINVDVAHKGFPKPLNCVELLGELFRNIPSELSRFEIEDVRKYLRGLKVEYQLPNQPGSRRTYRVNDLEKPASQLKFKLDDGTQLTVQQYFDKEKRHTLRYPNLPCLWVGNRDRPNKIFLPMEFCKIVRGQVVQKKMTELQTSNMIRKAATSTDVRKQKIMDALRSVRLSENDTVREFGLTVSDRFEEIDARILNAPALDYGPKESVQTVQPFKGVWRPSRFREGVTLNNWAILSLNRQTREDELRRLGREIVKMGQDVGMTVSECGSYRSLAPPFRDTRELEQYLTEQKRKKVELVVVVIPEKDAYAKVKQLAEIKIGILTQCIKGRTLGRLTGSTVSNILLKLNSKLNGVNHCLSVRSRPSCLERPVMIVGADVTHPSPDQTTIPSVAAVSASHDPTAFQYNMEYRLQPARVEIIQDLENIMRKQLMYFFVRTKSKPEKIIFYRDGVSEGQFEQVLNAELMAIRRACTSLEANYQPCITFLVVQKRHHTRFFPLRDQDADGKNRNVPPGTVVDTDITHPTELDFYLVSHASIQGVSRPTKYHRLWDDSDMDEDELENLTYYLCHLFSRCARSVSYPAPTYYAHLAAYRARVYLEGHQIQLGNLANEQRLRQTDANFVKNNPMYFV